ncbi:MAG: EB domain-containing protein [Polyangia bacterium]|jgi:hypothetical protein|nr:EB domain-containing protein [Polyangia bacterium]
MRRFAIVPVVILASPLFSLGLGLAGCGDDSSSGPDAASDAGPSMDVMVNGYQCTKERELILTRTECRLDVQCPCGAHCERGLCRHDCIDHDDCPEGWCDFLGYCRDVADRESLKGVTRPEQSHILLSPVSMAVYDWNLETPKTVTLYAPREELVNVRLVASAGLSVRCDTDYVSECVVPLVGAKDQVQVSLQVTPSTGVERQAWTLTAHVRDQIAVLGLSKARPPVVAPIEQGIFEGRIWMSAAHATLTTDQPLVEEFVDASFRMLDLPITARIYPDGTLVLSDTAGILPADWAFRLRADGSFDALEGTADLSRRVYLGGASTVTPTTTEIGVSGGGVLNGREGSIDGTLTMFMGGMGQIYSPAIMLDERHQIVWGVALTRAGDIPAGENPPPLGAADPPGFSLLDDRYGDPLPWELETAACFVSNPDFTGVGTGLAARIQAALCYNHGGGLDSVEFKGADPANLNASADLLCDDPNPPTAGGPADNFPTAFPIFTYGSRSVPLTPRQLLAHCLDDLAHLQGGPFSPSGQDGACLDELSGCGGDGVCTSDEIPRCLDVPLAVRSLALGMSAIARAGVPHQIHWSVTDEAGAKMGLRVLQQWIQLHTFVAREAAQEADQYFGTMDLNGLDLALGRAIAGWDLLLHPRVAARLLHLPAALLSDPDYRGAAFAPGSMSQDVTQAVGLPVVIAEGLRAQIEAARQLIYLTRFQGGTLPLSVVRTMRYAASLAPVAHLLYQRAAAQGPPAWEELWAESQDRLEKAIRRCVSEWRALQNGENPLGVQDDDLPLYRGLTNPDAAGQRFEAISTYIMDHFASSAVEAAAAAKATADAAWDLLLQRQIQADQQTQVPSRVTEIRRLYGEKIITLCGNPYNLRADEALDEEAWPGLDPNSCFMNRADTRCKFDEQAFIDKLERDDVGHQLCLQSRVKAQLGDRANLEAEDVNDWVNSINNSIRAKHDQTIDDYMPKTKQAWYDMLDPGIVETIDDYYFQCRDPQASCAVNDLFTLKSIEDPGTEDAKAFINAQKTCGAIFGSGKTLTEKINEDPALDMPDCYQGSIGELALAARSAAKDVEAAGSALQDYTDTYKAALWKCTIDDQALAMSQAVTGQLDALQTKLETYTSNVSNSIGLVRGVLSAVPTIIGLFTGDSDSRKQVFSSTVDLAGGWITGAFDEVSGLNNVKDQHKKFLDDFKEQIADAKCFHDAEMHLIGADTQARRAQKAKLDLSQALLKIRNAKAEVARLIREGKYRAGAAETQQRMSLFHDVWKDLWAGTEADYKGKVEEYRRKMRLAQRMLYLAVRAVEYELQVPRGSLRQSVLQARSPADMGQIVTQLEAIIGAGNIGGQAPGNRHVEFSLRETLLQLADRSDLPAGLNTMNDTERFRALLTDARYAHYDAEGVYDGQLIPFSLVPMGTLGIGDPGTVALLTGQECAERTWSLAVSLRGTDLTDDSSTHLQIGVLHKNDFYSQWCLTPSTGQGEMQVASVRPARNLFLDPVWGGDFGTATPVDSDYVISLVDAYFDVTWEEFSAPEYSAGSDTAFACRGLYGEYAIFLPAQILDIDHSGGLSLLKVEDIWLRFDYVSAARQWQ